MVTVLAMVSGPARQFLLERLPMHELHDKPGLTLFAEDVIDLNDIRMIDARGALRLDHDTFDQLSLFNLVDCVRNTQLLYRYRAS